MGTTAEIADSRLAEILGDPALAAPEEARRLALRISQALPLLTQRALEQGDRLVDLETAAGIVGKTRNWLLTNADRLPFMRQLGKEWLASERDLQQFIRERRKGR